MVASASGVCRSRGKISNGHRELRVEAFLCATVGLSEQPLRVTNGRTHPEHNESAYHPKADIAPDMRRLPVGPKETLPANCLFVRTAAVLVSFP